MREIKFRVWNPNRKKMEKLNLYNIELEWPKLQYTGLKDKNRKEIYEGDIVKVKQIVLMQDIYEVVWNEKIASFEYKDGPYIDDYGDVKPGILYPDACIVIGNIYENPELLERIK